MSTIFCKKVGSISGAGRRCGWKTSGTVSSHIWFYILSSHIGFYILSSHIWFYILSSHIELPRNQNWDFTFCPPHTSVRVWTRIWILHFVLHIPLNQNWDYHYKFKTRGFYIFYILHCVFPHTPTKPEFECCPFSTEIPTNPDWNVGFQILPCVLPQIPFPMGFSSTWIGSYISVPTKNVILLLCIQDISPRAPRNWISRPPRDAFMKCHLFFTFKLD